MTEYIEREAAIRHAIDELKSVSNVLAVDVETALASLPAADVVEVVRCKDCKHRHSSEFCECREPDAFCSDGERKETE